MILAESKRERNYSTARANSRPGSGATARCTPRNCAEISQGCTRVIPDPHQRWAASYQNHAVCGSSQRCVVGALPQGFPARAPCFQTSLTTEMFCSGQRSDRDNACEARARADRSRGAYELAKKKEKSATARFSWPVNFPSGSADSLGTRHRVVLFVRSRVNQ